MTRTLASTIICVALAGCGLGTKYPTFGESAYRIEGAATSPDGAAAPISTVIYRDHAKMRLETMLPGRGPATIVFDDATKAAYVITAVGAPAPPGATASNAAAPAPAAPSAQPAPAAPENTSATGYAGAVLQPPPTASVAPAPTAAPAPTLPANAVGVAVRLDNDDAPTPIEQPWQALTEKNARSTGTCKIAGEGGRLWSPSTAEAGQTPRTACITDDGIVLEIRENGAVLWQATRVERGAQDPALFGIPSGYAIVDPKAVADSVSNTLNKIGSVSGDAKAPVTTAKR